MNPHPSSRMDLPLTDDQLVLERIRLLVRSATRRQLWLTFLYPDDTLADAIMPCDDLPADPLSETSTEDGPVTIAAGLTRTLGAIMREFAFARAIFVWERPGGPTAEDEERAWARELAAECQRRDIVIAGQFLAHDRGVRPLAPDDYL
jgi:hypothetical protein